SSNGTVTIHLPRTFRGPLHLTTRNGSGRFSDALKAALTTFSEVNSTRRCFVGDFSDWTEEISVESMNGNVKVGYEVEVVCNLPRH
ncbi:hypothetical protein B0H13DRAFT_1630296, partial [Mycena leptocephala]